MNKVFIPHQFCTLNKYIAAMNRNRYIGNKIKQDETEIARLHFIGKKFDTPCYIKFRWFVKDKRTDPDNIAFAKKYILDGIVKAKSIPDDTMRHILGFTDEFIIDKNNVGVEVTISIDK